MSGIEMNKIHFDENTQEINMVHIHSYLQKQRLRTKNLARSLQATTNGRWSIYGYMT